VEERDELLLACRAVLDALERCDMDGAIPWIHPPYQAAGVHESAHERLLAVIEKYEIADYWVVVCDKCLTASCWHGEHMCQESDRAGTVKKLASELRQLKLEHSDNFSEKRLFEVCGQYPHKTREGE
jgi:hypothetical protein